METKHTPTPWKAEKGRTVMHVTGQHFVVCQISTTGYRGDTPEDKRMYAERAEANAAFIVRAVNAHDELVAALEDVRVPRMSGRGELALRSATFSTWLRWS